MKRAVLVAALFALFAVPYVAHAEQQLSRSERKERIRHLSDQYRQFLADVERGLHPPGRCREHLQRCPPCGELLLAAPVVVEVGGRNGAQHLRRALVVGLVESRGETGDVGGHFRPISGVPLPRISLTASVAWMQPTRPGRMPSTPPSAQLGTSPGGGGSG